MHSAGECDGSVRLGERSRWLLPSDEGAHYKVFKDFYLIAKAFTVYMCHIRPTPEPPPQVLEGTGSAPRTIRAVATHITSQPGYAPGNLATRTWRPGHAKSKAKTRTITSQAGRAWSPYTLRPAPCILPPTPYTLHLTPNTLNLTPYTLHYTLYTIHYTIYTLHPTPYTLNLLAQH